MAPPPARPALAWPAAGLPTNINIPNNLNIGHTCVQIRESVVKVVDGVSFGVRGVKLLFADIGAAGKLFWRAVRGE